ncbi:hypothetical protein CFD26_100688 [Aspergillus turcosus]|uniref:HNH nuclease domain-containing protein n=1 Tax=Aspergillus turcosus TaxID=1245748 RepID=A0A421CTT3_9EURO|nr:hypothetical protein CFD26_100688 [Aspergillus turcosus]
MSSSRRPAGLPLAAGSSRKRRRDSSSPEHNLAQPQKRATADRRPSNNSDTASPRGHDQSSSSSPLKVLSRSPSPPSDDETAPPAPPALAPATAPAAAAAPLIPPGPGSVLLGVSYDSNQTASPLHRHRSSLEDVILPATKSMNPQEQNQATSIFTRIVTHFEPSQTIKDRYKPITLITLLETEISEKSDFLRLFFEFIGKNLFTKEGEEEIGLGHVLSCLDDFASWGDDETNALNESLAAFAEFLMNNFFIPPHIIPHSLLSLTDEEGGRKLAESKQIAYMILKMFNPTAAELINGADIDRPVNALSMTIELHRLFGNFKIAFEQIGPPGSHMYKVDYVKPGHRVRVEKLPVTVSLPLPPERNIDPTSPELLAIHRAIGRILHLSAVGEYIDKFFRDMEELEGGEIMANGSTRIEDYVLFRLAGTEWLDETSVVEQHWRNATPVTDRGESMPAM